MKNFNSLKIDNRGFSLIQIVVSMAVTSILILAFSQFASDSFRMVIGLKRSLDIDDTVSMVRRSLSRNDECTLNLGNKGLRLTAADSAGVAIEGLDFHQADGTIRSSLLRTGSLGGGVSLTGIRLVRVATLAPDVIASNLVLTFDRGAGQIQVRPRSIAVVVKERAGVIHECWTQELTTHNLLNEICRQTRDSWSSDGFDMINERCQTVQTEWISGSVYTASCPAGYRMRPNPDNADCRATFQEAVQSSEIFSTRVPSSTGALLTATRPPAVSIFDANSRSCTCAYASDLGNLAATCTIRCLPQ